ncbi:hypothetical protein AUC47_07055 [Microbacterium sp. SZ1]|uniref:ATP-dependent nuclease n=1 Tax=Microbacterium sp. SZ1 TaxID=1849736 RepID=UPI000BD3E6A9|nr:AAA family ATPase [Microbacterium sp. SZ1]PCE13568.1 hypothetical protein AUC47_07055 [Microbacterium sp. SZ1]
MHLNFVIGYKSFEALPSSADLPNFMVVTGANGSGKTQFLEALNVGAFTGDWDRSVDQTLLLSAAQLGEPVFELSAQEPRRAVVERFKAQVDGFLRPNGYRRTSDLEGIYENLRLSFGISEGAMRAAEAHAGKPIEEWQLSDFELWTPFELGHGFFGMAVTDAFTRYQAMLTANDFRAWRASQGKAVDAWLTEEQFQSAYGPPPWDLLNEVLVHLALPYEFVAPPMDLDNGPFSVRLRSLADGFELAPADLSSGEKTLLQLALSMYSGTHRAQVSRIPKVLLLDEPDAALHPSMVRSMLAVIREVLVERLDMRVVMTTHSPTTVALSPDDAIFVMERTGVERLTRASKDAALRRLLVGVPAISVSAENRRVVLVESPNDARWYSSIYAVIQPTLSSERSLEFVAAGGSGLADGCDAVVGLVHKLRSNGNLAVWGLVDRDNRHREPSDSVIFNDEGYSIENLLLNPLAIGLLLLSDSHAAAVTAVPESRFVEFRPVDAQALVDAVSAHVLGDAARGVTQTMRFAGGLEIEVPSSWLSGRGHDLHDLILEKLSWLRRYAARDRLIDSVVSRVLAQYPTFVPMSVVGTVRRLLDA